MINFQPSIFKWGKEWRSEIIFMVLTKVPKECIKGAMVVNFLGLVPVSRGRERPSGDRGWNIEYLKKKSLPLSH